MIVDERRLRPDLLPPVVVALALVLLTVAVELGWWPVSVDRSLADRLPSSHAHGWPGALLALASALTTIATPSLSVALTLGVALRWAWQERSATALRAAGPPIAVLCAVVPAAKAVFHRPGPPGTHLHHLLGYYPSGHTTTAVVCGGTLALLAAQRHPGQTVRVFAGAATWTALVASSLVVHRYHWLTDVLAGLLLGGLILLLSGRLQSRT